MKVIDELVCPIDYSCRDCKNYYLIAGMMKCEQSNQPQWSNYTRKNGTRPANCKFTLCCFGYEPK